MQDWAYRRKDSNALDQARKVVNESASEGGYANAESQKIADEISPIPLKVDTAVSEHNIEEQQPHLTIAVVASELSFEKFAEKVSSPFNEAEDLAERNEIFEKPENEANSIPKVLIAQQPESLDGNQFSVPGSPAEMPSIRNTSVTNVVAGEAFAEEVPKKRKSAGFPVLGGLALFLVIGGLAGIGSLAIAGLLLSLWVIVPAVPLLVGVFIGIKVIYDKYQQRRNAYQDSKHVPDVDNKLDVTDENEESRRLGRESEDLPRKAIHPYKQVIGAPPAITPAELENSFKLD